MNPFAHKKKKKERTTELCSSVVHTSSSVAILTSKPASEHAHARMLPRLSWKRDCAAT
jgi:hypothetical protein